MHNSKWFHQRFLEAPMSSKNQKIKNKITKILKTHRLIYWHVNKKFKKEVLSKKFEIYLIPSRDTTIGKHLFINGDFDLNKLMKVNNLINLKNRTLIDVGANLGSICIPAVRRKIVQNAIAIEPDKDTFVYLEKNISLNLIDNIKTINAIAGAEIGSAIFGSKTINPGDSKVVNKENILEFQDSYPLPEITLNSLFEDVKQEKFLIWIDAQGYEPNILEGASSFTSVSTPMVIEVFPLGIKQYSNFKHLEYSLSMYSYFADLNYKINKPKFKSITEFKEVYSKLEISRSYSDFLFI
jgi:FkbM family methyltransferase